MQLCIHVVCNRQFINHSGNFLDVLNFVMVYSFIPRFYPSSSSIRKQSLTELECIYLLSERLTA